MKRVLYITYTESIATNFAVIVLKINDRKINTTIIPHRSRY
jgi:hypothetical protein